ncbi:MAG: CRISPR-associated protein, Csm1 family [Firmicutes bacterium]|nr:CRISPR-associated protein, Csm1 family [Bacillota bacterium]
MAALLHDIGKFIERAKSLKVDDNLKKVEKGHPAYSAQLLSTLRKEHPLFEKYSDKVTDAVLYHHQPTNDWQRIIQLADWLSSSEREKDETNSDKYNRTPLQSIFSLLFSQNTNNVYSYELKPLALNNIFPRSHTVVNEAAYKKAVDGFLDELGKTNNETQLYYLLEKYLWSVPAQTWHHIPDISLFDHSKTTAAIALCLYDQYQKGQLSANDLERKTKSDKEQFMLIKGDMSGIQEFIFNIPSKGAAKSLKGRSVYLSILAETIAHYLLDALDLKKANLLYCGGGNFYLLAPACKVAELEKAKKEILSTLLNVHEGDIYLALGSVFLSPKNFDNFSDLWDSVKKKVNDLKQKKWSELGLAENYKKIFGPLDKGEGEKGICKVCGTGSGRRKLEIHNGEIEICSLCASFIDLTSQLRDAMYCRFVPTQHLTTSAVNSYNDVLAMFGYRVEFLTYRPEYDNSDSLWYMLNSTSFIQEGCDGFKFGAYNLPVNANGEITTFDELSSTSVKDGIGDKKLGFLKLDVDNLGAIFALGFPNNKSISRITALSRMLSLYFEGYINKIIVENHWNNQLYVVFSGGDDTFVLGGWDAIFEFAGKFYEKFREYTCHNSKLTFSAGIGIFKPHYPLTRAASITEEALEDAKRSEMLDSGMPVKNKVSFLGEVFNWEEFKYIERIKNLLERMMTDGGYGRGLLYKVSKSTLGFKRILKDSTKGKFDSIRFWRLAYYLRDVKADDVKNKKNYAEKLIEEYRKIVIHNLMNKAECSEISNIMIIPAAIRWAELSTRKFREED